MSEQAQPPTPEAPRKVLGIPPRQPKGDSDWRVTVRHSPLILRSAVVKANGERQAWQKFLEETTAKSTVEEYVKRFGRLEAGKIHNAAQEWLKAARQTIPDGTEIIGAEYARKRFEAMRIRGAVTVEQVGFPELASA